MTELLERPAPAHLSDLACAPHAHTVRCWWHVELAGWVCPPSGDGST